MFRRLKNTNDDERIIRMSLGLILLVVALMWLVDPLKLIIIVLATYSLVTGVVGYCPVNEVLMGSGGRTRRPAATHRSRKKSRRR